MILALARPDQDGGAVVGRTLTLDAAFETEPRRRAMEAMMAARLVTLDEAAQGARSLRLTHEALLTHWPRAQRLLEDRRSALELRERLEGEAKPGKPARRMRPTCCRRAARFRRRWISSTRAAWPCRSARTPS